MDRGGPETARLGGPLRVSAETLGAPRDARVASWLDGGVRRGTFSASEPAQCLHIRRVPLREVTPISVVA